jgi:hypothetical protein
VKLGKNASDTCATLSKVYRREAMKKSSVFEWHIWFKGSSYVKITNEDNAHHDMKGTVQLEFSQTVKQAYCVEILKQLHEAVHRKRFELQPKNWILHHDNAPAHKVLSGPKINY